mmetsp:Transcript_8994/g.25185  ORF Transcript_8994/g.25185 Transcript_8994/m.25185 type:complete len:97 (+) Transcript_8994:92-382(+)
MIWTLGSPLAKGYLAHAWTVAFAINMELPEPPVVCQATCRRTGHGNPSPDVVQQQPHLATKRLLPKSPVSHQSRHTRGNCATMWQVMEFLTLGILI